ncbi:heterokaryon incompatibility protein-domain-containing protein [Exophiala viscosa]|uniref:Heterokaryon incompatibility protein-domain-containing protein n=1 Tax=Exophiala viscosa TaxID=2486360 RepID=A0AAN6DMV2_9EURO|nr:heterokaryon incompatibility protein-domain-containing protein [Exophiala viscosa]KAI1620795.1 heterokaryon incompatibility protein-domain-containing protein [Exophiala viscosa]
MTLSHWWGKEQPLMLEKHNILFLENIVQIEQLPGTYADAVVITLQMGCQYLWIDSLCIVQDSPEDRQTAVAEMSHVYRFSTCNIAALDACDSTEGCFSTVRVPHVSGCANEVDGRMYYATCDSIGYCRSCADRCPLYRRGWVLQERLLAPRTIGYHSFGLTWECLHEHEIERGSGFDVVIDTFKNALHQSQGPKQNAILKMGSKYDFQCHCSTFVMNFPCLDIYGMQSCGHIHVRTSPSSQTGG